MIDPILVHQGIYRGAAPTTDEDLEALVKLGIKYILDLETGARLMSDGSPLEETLKAAAHGIHSYSHPLGEVLPPSYRELVLAAGLMEHFQPIYVHCRAGVDRTGMVVAHYLMNNGWPKHSAVADMKARGMHWWYFWWPWFLPNP